MASHPITLTRMELYEKVWSQPVHTLPKGYDISVTRPADLVRRNTHEAIAGGPPFFVSARLVDGRGFGR
jgi:hypothetical protein